MESFGVVVDDVLPEEVTEVMLAEDDEVVEALVSDGADEAFSEGIAVRAAAGDADAFCPVVAEHGAPSFGEKQVPIVDEVSGMAEEPVTAVEKVAGNLLHPRVIGGDTDTGDVNPAGLELHHEEDQLANGAEGAEGLDSEVSHTRRGYPSGFRGTASGSCFETFRRDALATGDLGEDLAQDAILFVKVLKATSHALVERAHDERDEELDGKRKHERWGRMSSDRPSVQGLNGRRIQLDLAAVEFSDSTPWTHPPLCGASWRSTFSSPTR